MTTGKRASAEEERRIAIAELLSNLAIGLTDEQARNEMGLEPDEYDALKAALYAQETSRVKRQGVHEVFVDYVIAQRRLLGDLEDLHTKASEANSFTAAIGALKASSEIHDKIVKTGQDLGVIDKRVDEKRHLVVHGSIDELRAAAAAEVKRIEAMMREDGGRAFLELEPGPIHREDVPVEAEIVEPISTAGKSTVYAGRRVVKEPAPPG